MNLAQRMKKRIRGWVDAILQGHNDHYTCTLPKESGFLSSLVLTSIFSDVYISSTQALLLKKLSQQGFIVFASKYESRFEYLFYHVRYKNAGLPFPVIGFEYRILLWQKVSRLARIILSQADYFLRHRKLPNPYESDFFKREMENGAATFLSLLDSKGFYYRFGKAKHEPLSHLIKMQRESEKPIFIIPQWLLFSKKPHRAPKNLVDVLFGSEENPGRLRRWAVILRAPEKAFVEASEPVNLKDFLHDNEGRKQDDEQLSVTLRHDLLDQMSRHRQSITGPALKTPEELKELILRNDRFQKILKSHAETQNKDMSDSYREADGYLNDIAADYSPGFIKAMSVLIGWIWKTMYDGITLDMEGLHQVKRAATRAPLVFVPCHKSHFDYLILNYLLYTNNMPCPHVAAGRNMAFWPVGTLFRKSGAFFLRRTFRGAKLYAAVFAAYVQTLIEQGVNIEFFIEGGRSRTGKLVLPKTGLISMLLEPFRHGASRDLAFVPVYIGYDRLLEEGAILKELEGRGKEKESFWQLIQARKVLKKRHGRVYVQFAEPISVRALTASADPALQDMDQAAFQAFGRNLSYRIINAINRISVVTAQSLTAAAILNCPKPRFSQTEMMNHVETYLNFLLSQNSRLSENLHDPERAVENVLAAYTDRKFLGRQQKKGEDEGQDTEKWYVVWDNKRLNLEYYKNNCIHSFIPAAYTALSILSYDAFQFSASALHSDYHFLQDFFKYEFAYDVDKTPTYMVRKTLKAFIDDAILMPHPTLPDTYNITASGFRKLLFFAGFLKTYFESYWIVLNVLKTNGKGELVKKECMKKIRVLGNQLYKQQEIERSEALSQINYGNGLTFFNFKGIKGAEDDKKIAFYSEIIQKYLGCFAVQK
jgi:glycerol-3-phosphate O-acyltransferase